MSEQTDNLPAPGTFTPAQPDGAEPERGWFEVVCKNCGSAYCYVAGEIVSHITEADGTDTVTAGARITCGWCKATSRYGMPKVQK